VGRGTALIVFGLHFLVTQSWSAVFFGMQEMSAALMVLGFGIVSLLAALALIQRVRRKAALLLLPYLAWLCFAAALNYQFIASNPDGGATGASGSKARVEL
jgi:tryptophan-rich sensory protein